MTSKNLTVLWIAPGTDPIVSIRSSQLSHCLFPFQGFQHYFRLEPGGVISTRSSHGFLLLSLAIIMAVQ